MRPATEVPPVVAAVALSDWLTGPHQPWYEHAGDVPLCGRLGLPLDFRAPHGEWTEWGIVALRWDESSERGPYARITVEVLCMPAVGFRFTVEPLDGDGQACVITTGTGALSHYWPFVEQVAQGMIAVTPRAAAEADAADESEPEEREPLTRAEAREVEGDLRFHEGREAGWI